MTSDLTPEYLAGIRSAANHAIRSNQYPALTSTDDRATVQHVAYTDTLGGAETVRTLLQTVPTLLNEVDRLRHECAAYAETLSDVAADREWMRDVLDEMVPARLRQILPPGQQ